MKKQCWKRVSSGKYVDLNNFTPEDVDIEDIETSLNTIWRFTGHHKDVPPLTVAQHSLLCLELARLYEPNRNLLHKAVFSHDFAEAYIGDVATPVKKAMGSHWYDFADPIENAVDIAVSGHTYDESFKERVKLYDLAALDLERRVMWKSQLGKDYWPPCPLDVGTIADKEAMFFNVRYYVPIKKIWRELNK